MAKILIVGNPESPLVRERGLVGQEAGHQIFWFYRHQVHIPGVTSFGLPGHLARLPRLHHFFEPFYLADAIKNIHPDLIHVHFASKGLLAIPLSRFHPLVVTAMGSDISPTVGYRGLYAPFTRRLLESADCITVKSAFMQQMLRQIGDFAYKTKRVTWGVDLDLFRPDRAVEPLRRKMGIPESALVFFDPRAIHPLYNKHLVLEAFRRYVDAGGAEAVLLIAGFNADKRYMNQLQKQVDESRLRKSVLFIPQQNRFNMADLYSLADIVVSFPRSDGFPQTIYEAWASGRFMILSDLPQYRDELRDGITARLVDLRDVQALADSLNWVSQHSEARLAARKTGPARARAIADKSVETEKMNQIYVDLLTKQTKSAPH